MSADLHDASLLRPTPGRHGCCVVIVGASGTGKDSLLGYAQGKLVDNHSIVFMRRVITRAPVDDAENHMAVTAEKFVQMRKNNAFCVSWDAHGLSYGISTAALTSVQAGRTVVFNGSRGALDDIADVFERLLVVEVVADPFIVRERLNARNRESADDINLRIARNADVEPRFKPLTIRNDGTLKQGGDALVEMILGASDMVKKRSVAAL